MPLYTQMVWLTFSADNDVQAAAIKEQAIESAEKAARREANSIAIQLAVEVDPDLTLTPESDLERVSS